MFRGKNRLRGFFGGDLFFGYAKYSDEFEYGNQMTVLNPAPSTAAYIGSAAQRPLTINYGAEVILGLGAFTGAEYLIRVARAEMGLVYKQTIGSGQRITNHGKSIYFTGDKKSRRPAAVSNYSPLCLQPLPMITSKLTNLLPQF